MASDDSFEEDNPFGGLPFFGDLGKLFNHGGPIAWDVARQFAYQIATEGEAEPNVDPLDRIKLNELARVAELRVADITSLGAGFSDQAVSITATTRSEWASKTLDAYQPLLERLAGRLAKGTESTDVTEPEMQMLDGLMRAMNPMMMAMSAGSIAGHLATKAFGNYELPIPRPNAQLLVVIANVDLFASEWSLPRDDVWLWVCINELATQSVMNVTHVRNEFDRLLNGYVDGFETSPQGLENRFMDLDIGSGDPAELQAKLQNALSDPENLLGAVRSDAQSALIPDLNALLGVVVGYVDYVVEKVSRQLLESYESLSEVAKRRRFSASPGDRFVEKLLGVEVTPELLTRGTEFISGVIDRAGESALSRLWTESDALPTPNELDAPGLWLARIDLPNLDSD
ncbi:MAG: zinc-dependent metalloprotease [Acidimicrobiales bacterium]|nr:zinc-dependent metalloprotease [Acidimicrobiales bacterium]